MKYTVLLVLLLSATAYSQPVQAPLSDRERPQAASPRIASGKLRDCQQKLRSQGLRGDDLANQVGVCVAEAQLGCAKQAADQKIVRAARRGFMDTCMGRQRSGSNREPD